MTTTDLDPEVGLANIEDGRAPKERLSTATQAQELGQMLIRANVSRSAKNASLKGAIDGNPPFNSVKLRANSQAWRTNITLGGAEASVSAGVSPYNDLINGAPYYAEIRTEYGTAAERVDYSQILTEQFDYILRDWDGFDFNLQAMLFDMVGFGKGFLVWLDPTEWKFEWVEQFLVYVPERTKAFTGKVPMIMLRLNYELHELWEKIMDEKSAKDAGWKVGAVKQAIQYAYPPNPDGSLRGTYASYEVIQQKLKENELYEGYRSKVVQVLHFFVVEFDGKVSELIVEEITHQGDSTMADRTDPEFLYKSIGKYDSLSDVVATFFFESADGKWNGARGLAQKLFPIIAIQNRLFCSLIDNAFMRSGISLQATTAEAVQKLNLIQIGPFNVIPPGFTVQQSTIMGDLSGALETDRALEQKLTEATGIYKPRMDKPVGNPRTAHEVQLDYERSATLSATAVMRFYRNCDRFYKTLFPRVARSKEFKKRLEEQGIPKDLIGKVVDKVCSVKAYRTIGNGNAFMRRSALEQMQPLVPMMPEQGKIAWLRDSVAAITNRETTDRYAPLPETDMPTEDSSIATLENAAIKIGSPVIWTPVQNNVIHAQIHLQAGAQAAASVQQGGNPLEVIQFLDGVGAHAAIHLQHLQGDPTRVKELKILGDQWKQLAGVADGLRKVIEQKAREAAAQQQEKQSQAGPQVDPDVQAKMEKTKADIQMKEAKNQQLLAHKDQKFKQDMAIHDAEAAANIARQNAEARNKQAEMAAKAAATPKTK